MVLSLASVRTVQLPNVGQECYAYLQYLVDLYDALPDAVVFLQGDGVRNGLDFEQKARGFSQALFAMGRSPDQWLNTFRSVNDQQYLALSSRKEDCNTMLASNCMQGKEGHARPRAHSATK